MRQVMDNESRGDTTRNRLVSAAIEILATRGVHNTTFVAVSRHCDLTRGAVHHHFKSLPELLVAVVHEIGSRIHHAAAAPVERLPDFEARAKAAVDSIWLQMQSAEFRALLQLRNAVAIDTTLQGDVRASMQRLNTRWFGLVAAEPNVGAVDLQLLRIILSSMTGAAALDAAIGAPLDDPDRIAYRDRIKAIMLR